MITAITKEFKDYYLKNQAQLTLRNLLATPNRGQKFSVQLDTPSPLLFDFSKENLDDGCFERFQKIFDSAQLQSKIDGLGKGEKVNFTENKPALHSACRTKAESFIIDGVDVAKEVHGVRSQISTFSEEIRSGKRLGVTGKHFDSILNIGIGGSLLGLKSSYEGLKACEDVRAKKQNIFSMRCIANVDPADFGLTVEGVDPETTLVIISSKSFTTMETALNLALVKEWLVKGLQAKNSALTAEEICKKHLLASTANPAVAAKAGFPEDCVFKFWDWVGGRYSVSSACGILPLSIALGYDTVSSFLDGMQTLDHHFFTEKDWKKNIPVLMGLIDYFHINVQGYPTKCIIPYSQPLHSFLLHIAQLEMESNGKIVQKDGEGHEINHTGGIVFGDTGSNCQHSFFQLVHHGRVVPVEFIVFANNALDARTKDHPITHHEELSMNYFAQVKCLALGRTAEELTKAGMDPKLIPYNIFEGNRPTSSLIFSSLTSQTFGALFSIYENKVAVEGFISGINSFDQYGVELGKKLCTGLRDKLKQVTSKEDRIKEFGQDEVNGEAFKFFFTHRKE